MSPYLTFLIFCLTAVSVLADPRLDELNPAHDAIVNGRPPEGGSPIIKSTVMILPIGDNASNCTGTAIARDLIVTAGHCVTKTGTNNLIGAADFVVDFSTYYNGDDDLPRATSVRVQAIRLYPTYNHALVDAATYPHDVALIRLAGPLKNGYVPARFLPRSLRIQSGDEVVAAGFGDRSFKDTSPDYKLLTFDFRLGNRPGDTTLVTLQATRSGGIGAGDSGGPAWARKNGALYFFGVASSGEEEGMAEAAYENLEAYRGWLEQAAASMGSQLSLP